MGEMATQIVNWNEVFSPNMDKAKSFYHAVFGWNSDSMPMGEGGDYTFLMKGETAFAGIMDLSNPVMEGVPPHWGIYFHVPNCAATKDRVLELGGELVYGPMDIPDIGTVAGFRDCCGAHFNVHQPANEQRDISCGAINWVEHMGPNREGAVSFYKSLFGWGSMDMPMGEPVGTYSMFTVGEEPVAGCMNVDGPGMPPNWMIYLHSDNLESTCDQVTANEGKILNPPMDIGQFGRIAIGMDCCGAVFGIHEPPKGAM